jgi:hypothetical protein
MTSSRMELVVRKVHLGLLWGASLLVPASKRAEWSEEWQAELWYVLRECSSRTSVHPRSVKEATAFCIGAYRDAIWLRRRSWQAQQPLTQIRGSVFVCALALVGILFATWEIGRLSPRVVAVNEMARICVSRTPRLSEQLPTLYDGARHAGVEDQVKELFRFPQRYFDGFSHYSIKTDTVSAQSIPATEWRIAHAPPTFFVVTNLPVQSIENAPMNPAGLPQLVLSERAWLEDFGGRRKLAGTQVRIDSVDAIVTGVASSGSMTLPGGADAWLLDADSQSGKGEANFVVGHLTAIGYFQAGPRWAISVIGMILAVLMMPFTMHSSIGQYGKGAHKPPLVRRSRFWAFLAMKIAFILAIVYFASLDLGCSLAQPFSHSSGILQGVSALVLCLLALNWSFRDQQRRCPVCLRRLSHPVEVGQLSRTFLAWSGTELVCERGHVLLHVPGIPTSWFDVQRWVCLDRSWQFLFARLSGTQST